MFDKKEGTKESKRTERRKKESRRKERIKKESMGGREGENVERRRGEIERTWRLRRKRERRGWKEMLPSFSTAGPSQC